MASDYLDAMDKAAFDNMLTGLNSKDDNAREGAHGCSLNRVLITA